MTNQAEPDELRLAINPRRRAHGLTTLQVAEFNKAVSEGKAVRWEAPGWVAIDRKTLNRLYVSRSAVEEAIGRGESSYMASPSIMPDSLDPMGSTRRLEEWKRMLARDAFRSELRSKLKLDGKGTKE